MHILRWILPPLLGTIIALCTNWLAIVMLFRPHNERRIFGWRVPLTPGLIPRERARLGRKMGEAISVHLLTPDVLAQALADPERWPLPDCTVQEALEKWGEGITETVTGALKNAADTLLPKAPEYIAQFPQKFPMLDEKLAELTRNVASQSVSGLASMFVKKDKIYTNIKEWLAEHLAVEENREALRVKIHEAIDNLTANEQLLSINIRDTLQKLPLHKILTFLAANIASRMPIADMVEQKMATYDVAEAEAMILSVVGRELRIIVMLGGVFGFFIGLLSLIPMISA